MQEQNLMRVNIHLLLEKFKSKNELYRFLEYDCQAYLPKKSAVNVYFLKKILKGEKEYVKRENVKISSVPHIEGLTVQDFLKYARTQPNLHQYLPDECDWVHLDRQWICNVLLTIDTNSIQQMIDNCIKERQRRIEQNQNLTVQLRPEFLEALNKCQQFSNEKGRSTFLLKDSSKRKRKREEVEEVKEEEEYLKEDRQKYLQEHKKLKVENSVLGQELFDLYKTKEIIDNLIERGILNQDGNIQEFQI